jgi:RHS repeat-associated protein
MSARRSCSRIVLLLWLACAPAAPIWADTTAPQYDPNGNLTSRATALGTTDYSYDALDRLKTEFGPGVDQSFGYDGNGNRQSDAANVYTLAPNGNRIQTVNGITQVYDPAGQLLDDGRGRSFAYNAAGRLKEVRVNNALVASYKYNYQGLRTHKITPQGTTLYHYDIQGHLIQTTDQVGTPKQSLHWADDRPIAQVDHTPEGDRLVYLHTDHLNTPRTATDAAGTVVWRWEGGAFGETLPEEDVEGDGVATIINLRLAGQYFDAETGLHYNWHRYYDPKVGRYIQFDPVGIVRSIGQAQMPTLPKELKRQLNVPWPDEVIESGLNQPYAYADNNPLRWTDPSGLSSGILGCRILGCDNRSVADEICPKVSEKAGGCWYSCSDGIYLAPKGKSCPPTCRPAIREPGTNSGTNRNQ